MMIMNIKELWRAKREDRFTLKHHLYVWFISTRAFALPWVMLYTLSGALLAGLRDVTSAVVSMIIVALVLLGAHFRNNYRDVELGVDRYVDSIEEAERAISIIKPYTAAAWLVPLRITSVRFQKVNEVVMYLLSLIIFILFMRKTLFTTIFYLTGLLMALTYTDFWKRKGLGEASAFLGHGFSTTVFGFLSQSDDILTAMLIGIAPGLISGFAYSIDQYLDIKTDFIKKVRSLAEAWFKSRLPLGLYVIAIYFAYIHLVTLMILFGVYPRGMLLTYLAIPLIFFVASEVEYDRERGVRDGVFTLVFLIPLLNCLGVLIK
jgi:1,4-dihydroxy-2-naphthoate octaprenyltransferase